MKKCSDCDKVLPLGQFQKNKAQPDGLQNICRPCGRKRADLWRKKNPEMVRSQLDKDNIRRHGMNPEVFYAILKAQGGVCAICGNPPNEGKRLAIDHDHSCCDRYKGTCGKCNRGLLCANCNTALGLFQEEPKILESAIQYLRKYGISQ